MERKEQIKNIIENSNIVDVISGYVKLERKGKNYFGVCPFHSDTNPSMSVSQDKGIYKCFSCGATGNSVTFIQEHEQKSFSESINILAKMQGIKLNIKENSNSKLYDITNRICEFYIHYLNSTKSGQEALKYLKDRQMSVNLIQKFKIGLAPSKGDIVYRGLKKLGFSNVDMLDAGVVKKSSNYYDSFRGRIIFPIQDENNNVVGYSGRIYKENIKDEAKYVNSSENKIFSKTNVLYNLNNAKREIKKEDKVFIYEGFMDVIAVSKANVNNAVATMGTALTKEHIFKVLRFTKNIVLCFDGDEAGINATSRAIDLLCNYDVNVRVVVLPNKLDPDDFIINNGVDEYINYISTNSIDSIEFQYRLLKKGIDLNSIIDIEIFKKEVFKLLKKYKSESLLEIYFNKLSRDIKISKRAIVEDYNYKKVDNRKQNDKINVIKRPINKVDVVKKSNNKINSLLSYERADIELNKFMMISDKIAYKINKELGSLFFNKINASIRYKMIDFYNNKKVDKISKDILEIIISPVELDYFNKNYKMFYNEVNNEAVIDCINTLKQFAIKKREYKLSEQLMSIEKTNQEKLEIGMKLRELTIKKESLEKKR